MPRPSFTIALTILTLSLPLGSSLAIASGGVDPCDKIKPALRVKAGMLLRKFRAKNKATDKGRSILLLVPDGKPEITSVELPAGLTTASAHISKTTLDAVKKAAGKSGKVIVWNDYGGYVRLLPYETEQEMATSFNPTRDCSPSSETLRRLSATCDLVDFSAFTSGATVLYEDTAKKCILIDKYSRKANLTKEEEAEYNEAKKKLALEFGAGTGESRKLAIDKESTAVLPKKDAALEIGDSMPDERNKAETAGSLATP